MLDDIARIERYQIQTGRQLTDRQHRRINHKRGHQLVEAQDVRAKRSAARAKVREARKRPSVQLPASR